MGVVMILSFFDCSFIVVIFSFDEKDFLCVVGGYVIVLSLFLFVVFFWYGFVGVYIFVVKELEYGFDEWELIYLCGYMKVIVVIIIVMSKKYVFFVFFLVLDRIVVVLSGV